MSGVSGGLVVEGCYTRSQASLQSAKPGWPGWPFPQIEASPGVFSVHFRPRGVFRCTASEPIAASPGTSQKSS